MYGPSRPKAHAPTEAAGGGGRRGTTFRARETASVLLAGGPRAAACLGDRSGSHPRAGAICTRRAGVREGLRGGLVRLVSLEPLAERRDVDPKAFRKRRETVLRELLAERQGHQQRRGESICG